MTSHAWPHNHIPHMLLTWAGHKVSAANDIRYKDFARVPAEFLKVWSPKRPHYSSGQGRVCVRTCRTSKAIRLCNMLKINGQLMPGAITVVATCFHCKITEGNNNSGVSDLDSLMSCSDLSWITGGEIMMGLEMWAPDCLWLFGRGTPGCPSLCPWPPRNPPPLEGVRERDEREGSVMNKRHWRTPKGGDIWSASHIPTQDDGQ